MTLRHSLLILASLALSIPAGALAQVNLDKLKLPDGFEIEFFAESAPGARQLAIGDNGTVFFGTRAAGNVTALMDTDRDGRPDRRVIVAEGLPSPAGVAILDGDLYVAAVNRILRYRDIESVLPQVPFPEVVTDAMPTDRMHGWKHINVGPDGRIYFGIGAPGNVLDAGLPYATINAIDPQTGEIEMLAEGIRNSVSLDWNPQTGNIWFTENGRDMMGDDLPPDELNVLLEKGTHYGYPFIHGSNVPDPEFGSKVDLETFEFQPPLLELQAHVAAVGIEFYEGDMFPEEYKQRVFWAERGSWNRSSKIGYRVMMATYDGDTVVSHEPFITGWLQPGEQVLGRPVDFLEMADGSLLVSDDHAGVIYRVTYTGNGR